MAQFQVECIESYTEPNSSTYYSKFELQPLDRGQGITIGNALRRILLSNLEGAAITAVRIAGVSHEFSSIPGVREDVLDLFLNMKEIVLRSHSSESLPCRLHVRGPATVTAADFELPTDVEVINPKQYIATLAEGAVLEMEVKVERGKGYRAVQRTKGDQMALDFLQLDAVFMPVRKVKYEVETIVSGKEKLSIEITSNGSITPQDALSKSAHLLVDLFSPLQELDLIQSRIDEPDPGSELTQVQIEELRLSVRAYNCLKRAQINTIQDLMKYSKEDLLEIKNFGQKSADEVMEALGRYSGLVLPEMKQKAS
ncbi:MAG: DNA-directed RNA polymerase subunit alpha [Pseudanabaenaceae cyanobacterium bins.68]|nr:DNA-directed RNA polymerase subunit alpha [Pseudanabaenaceae cyanobacterium bins.68]